MHRFTFFYVYVFESYKAHTVWTRTENMEFMDATVTADQSQRLYEGTMDTSIHNENERPASSLLTDRSCY